LAVIDVHDEDAAEHADLGRGQAHPVVIDHGFFHIFNEFTQAIVKRRDGSCVFIEDGIALGKYLANGHIKPPFRWFQFSIGR
jgi:hypothetical protein